MADNTNNNVNSRIKTDEEIRAGLSESERVFVPKDLDSDGNLIDYVEYQAKVFRSVPENCVLVTKNIFTGNIKMKATIDENGNIIMNKGFKFMTPFLTKSILVSTVDRTIDYDKIEYLTNNGITVNVDIAAVVHIIDPVKYMKKGKEQVDQLNILVKQLLRVYIANRNFVELSQGECNLNEFDSRNKFEDFADEYGIRVDKIIFKEVKLSEEWQKRFDDVEEAKKKREAQLEQLEAERERAEMDAKIVDIQAQAEAKRIESIEASKTKMYSEKIANVFETLKNKGMSDQEIIAYLKTATVSSRGNAIFMGGDTSSNNVAMGVAAGNIASQRMNSGNSNRTVPSQTSSQRQGTSVQSILDGIQSQKVSKSQELINLIEQYRAEGKNISPQCMNLYNMLQNENARNTIDHASEEDYGRVKAMAFQGMEPLDNQQSMQGNGRGRR